jgi:hypothetical protein
MAVEDDSLVDDGDASDGSEDISFGGRNGGEGRVAMEFQFWGQTWWSGHGVVTVTAMSVTVAANGAETMVVETMS